MTVLTVLVVLKVQAVKVDKNKAYPLKKEYDKNTYCNKYMYMKQKIALIIQNVKADQNKATHFSSIL